MKRLHRPDLFTWSTFREPLNIDFNATLWTRPEGNIAIDPLALTPHDRAHLNDLGGISLTIVTNSMHLRAAPELGAPIAAPIAERDVITAAKYLQDGDEPVPGLKVYELQGSKTPGELLLVLEETTLITGDLIRAHAADSLHLLGPDKLKDRSAAFRSIRRVVELHPRLEHVIVGDGWHTFSRGMTLLQRLLDSE